MPSPRPAGPQGRAAGRMGRSEPALEADTSNTAGSVPMRRNCSSPAGSAASIDSTASAGFEPMMAGMPRRNAETAASTLRRRSGRLARGVWSGIEGRHPIGTGRRAGIELGTAPSGYGSRRTCILDDFTGMCAGYGSREADWSASGGVVMPNRMVSRLVWHTGNCPRSAWRAGSSGPQPGAPWRERMKEVADGGRAPNPDR